LRPDPWPKNAGWPVCEDCPDHPFPQEVGAGKSSHTGRRREVTEW